VSFTAGSCQHRGLRTELNLTNGQIARFQPCSRFWKLFSRFPSKSFLTPRQNAIRSKHGLRPDQPVSPIITARQQVFPTGRGGLSDRISRRKSASGRECSFSVKSAIISPDRASKPAISSTTFSTLIPRGKRGDHRARDKPITRPYRTNMPRIPPGQKEDLENKFL
jgi:hypothetical protein